MDKQVPVEHKDYIQYPVRKYDGKNTEKNVCVYVSPVASVVSDSLQPYEL